MPTIVGKLAMHGYRGSSNAEIVNSIPIDVYCSIVYSIVTEHMDEKAHADFDLLLDELSTDRMHEREERDRAAREAANLAALEKIKEG